MSPAAALVRAAVIDGVAIVLAGAVLGIVLGLMLAWLRARRDRWPGPWAR